MDYLPIFISVLILFTETLKPQHSIWSGDGKL